MEELEKKIAATTSLVLENRRLQAQILQLKQSYQLDKDHWQQEIERLGRRAAQRSRLLQVLDRYTYQKQNLERSAVQAGPGVILGRPSALRQFLAPQDQQAMKLAAAEQFPEFGFAQAPVFGPAAEEELQELLTVREAWQTLEPRYQELLEAKERATEFEKHVRREKSGEISTRSEIGSSGSMESQL